MPNPIVKTLHLGESEYFERHLSIVNCVLPKQMTPMEIKVVAAFMTLQGETAAFRFTHVGRKIVRTKLDISSPSLSGYEKALKAKGFIKEVDGEDTLLPLLSPQNGEQQYMIRLVLNGEGHQHQL